MKKFDYSIFAVIAAMLFSLVICIFLIGCGFTMSDVLSKDFCLILICSGFFGLIFLSFKYGAFFNDLARDRENIFYF